jgi:hypothetical protein
MATILRVIFDVFGFAAVQAQIFPTRAGLAGGRDLKLPTL